MNHAIPLLLLLGASSLAAAPDLSSVELDPRLQIDLFAAEPDVVDPVALTFDEAGRMYVIEMRDYPYGLQPGNKPGGTIRLLEDTDGDGKADKSTLFAGDLSFPTSIVPYDGGVFVAAPPDIIYLKDTNDDGRADLREVWFTGFVQGVTDSNMNGLRWGLDNRIHGLNGGNGGRITSPKKADLNLELGEADFSFDPKNLDFAQTYQSSGGFGLVFDEYGRSFVTHNINHIQQRILPLYYLWRFPAMLPVTATRSISDHGDMARIFPISEAQTRPNHPEQAGHFSSAGGLGFIGYDAYPADLYRSVTVGDVVGNLIHRDVLVENGSIFQARRGEGEADREFLASRDSSARFVGLELGPDGALYVIDMQRDVIEHPDYIPEKMRKGMSIRAGEDRGRIYRITPRQGLPKVTLNLAKATRAELVQELEHHNQWRRMTAQRLIFESSDRSLKARLSAITRSKFAPARAHALWTLKGIGTLDDSDLSPRFSDTDPGVVANAIRIAELVRPTFLGGFRRMSITAPLHSDLYHVAAHSSKQVRLQLALTLGNTDDPRGPSTLQTLLVENKDDYWIRMAALSSLADPGKQFSAILAKLQNDTSPGSLELVRDLADLSVARAEHPTALLVEIVTALDSASNQLAVAGLEGLERGIGRKGLNQPRLAIQPVLSQMSERNGELFLAVWKLTRRLGLRETPDQRSALQKSTQLARDANTSRVERLRAIDRLRFGAYRDVREALFANLNDRTDAELQSAALAVLRNFRDTDVAKRLVQLWPVLSPSVRPSVLNLLLSRRTFHDALVSGIESSQLKLGELNLDLEQRRALLRHSTTEIKARAAKFIGDEEYSNRKSVADEWLARLPAEGNPDAGRPVFEKLCAQCHRAADLGHAVGPDLTSISHRSVEDILYNILDPNMAINPVYTSYQVETTSGDLLAGILASETPEELTLLQANEIKSTIPRKEIARLRSTGTSLMPEGLEAGLTPQELRDLIAFLQTGK